MGLLTGLKLSICLAGTGPKWFDQSHTRTLQSCSRTCYIYCVQCLIHKTIHAAFGVLALLLCQTTSLLSYLNLRLKKKISLKSSTIVKLNLTHARTVSDWNCDCEFLEARTTSSEPAFQGGEGYPQPQPSQPNSYTLEMKRGISIFTEKFLGLFLVQIALKMMQRNTWLESLSLSPKDHRLFTFTLQQCSLFSLWISQVKKVNKNFEGLETSSPGSAFYFSVLPLSCLCGNDNWLVQEHFAQIGRRIYKRNPTEFGSGFISISPD